MLNACLTSSYFPLGMAYCSDNEAEAVKLLRETEKAQRNETELVNPYEALSLATSALHEHFYKQVCDELATRELIANIDVSDAVRAQCEREMAMAERSGWRIRKEE